MLACILQDLLEKEKIFGNLKNIPKVSIINIDWRKSASSNKVLIKQNEKELSKTIYLYFDRSYSMNYKSKNISYNKLFFSALLTLTLCKLFSKK